MTTDRSAAARAAIFARIRAAKGGGPGTSRADLEAIQTYVRARPRGPMPEVPGDLRGDLRGTFQARAESLQSTAEVIAREDGAPAAVARYLAAHGLPRTGCVWPALAHLDWSGAGLQLQARGACNADAVGVTGAFAGLAETGTLMLVSAEETPASVSLLPETHVALLHASRIVSHMEHAWDLARRELGLLPRSVNFISGPSRTGDIEQKMVLGAHGPYRVHIVIVEDR